MRDVVAEDGYPTVKALRPPDQPDLILVRALDYRSLYAP